MHPLLNIILFSRFIHLSQHITDAVGLQYTFVAFDLEHTTYCDRDSCDSLITSSLVWVPISTTLDNSWNLSGICASGSINQIMMGEQYNRSMRAHKIVL